MKNLKDIINEKLVINKNIKINDYKYHPIDFKDLTKLLQKLIKQRGLNADLNDIDTSKITDMSQLFSNFRKFNGDISKWDVSNVEDMTSMFAYSDFDCSNGDISIWNPRGHVITKNMFTATPKQNWKNIPKWLKD